MSSDSMQHPSTSSLVESFTISSEHRSLIHPLTPYKITVGYELSEGSPGGTLQITQNGETLVDALQIGKGKQSGSLSANLTLPKMDQPIQVQLVFSGHDPLGTTVYYGFPAIYKPPKEGQPASTQFPEQALDAYKDRTDLGICLSGGGTRAMILGMGQLRFLSQYKSSNGKTYLERAGYLSSVSGGSWAAAVYTYGPGSNEVLLGSYNKEKPLSDQISSFFIPPMAYGNFYSLFMLRLLSNVLSASKEIIGEHEWISIQEKWSPFFPKIPVTPDRVWIDAVGGTYFWPNGMYNNQNPYQDAFTLDEGFKNRILRDRGSLPNELKNLGDNFRTVNLRNGVYPPFLIMNSLMLRPTNSPPLRPAVKPGETTTIKDILVLPQYIGYEYTPLYHGPTFNGTWPGRSLTVGGGNMEMFSYSQQGVGATVDDRMVIQWENGDAFPSLAVASGTSSSAFAGATSTGIAPNIATWKGAIEWLINWFKDKENVAQLESLEKQSSNDANSNKLNASQQDFLSTLVASTKANDGNDIVSILKSLLSNVYLLTPKANYVAASSGGRPNTDIDFGDAGLSDNFGIMALLRRKVKKIVVCVNTETPFIPKNSSANPPQELKMDEVIQALFGVSENTLGNWAFGIRLNNLQVFETDQLANLQAEFTRFSKAGKPLVVSQTGLTVKANPAWDIEAGKVDVLWVYNSLSDSWKSAVGDSFLNDLNINNGQDGTFPFLNTFVSTLGGLSPKKINLLSSLSFWNLKASQSTLDAFLNA
ncbi:MAG: hypothetical protein ACFB10_05845 [Salibacteraceae bacterium]